MFGNSIWPPCLFYVNKCRAELFYQMRAVISDDSCVLGLILRHPEIATEIGFLTLVFVEPPQTC